jgi:hypothetical protein
MQHFVAPLACEFSEGLHSCLSGEQMQVVVELNRAETDPWKCQLHDLCVATLPSARCPCGAAQSLTSLYGALRDEAWN